MAMFEIIVNVVLSFDNNLIIKNFSYDFDYGKESMELFKKIYASKGIIFDENLRKFIRLFLILKILKIIIVIMIHLLILTLSLNLGNFVIILKYLQMIIMICIKKVKIIIHFL